jgi:uncharacterized protein (TIGR03067 family)
MNNRYAGFGLLAAAVIFAGCATVPQRTAPDVSLRSTTSPDDDAKAVQGHWKPAKAEFAGQPMTDAVLKSISLRLDNGQYEVFVADEPDRGTYTLDIATTPRGMTITGTAGPNSGKTFPAIYELKGNMLRICYDLSGAKRPTEFRSLAGTRLYLVTYNRTGE